jgi:threonine dehydratase
MRRTRKGTSKRRYKGTSKRTFKRVARKQSGGNIDMKKLESVLKQRSRASKLAGISSKKAEEFKKQAESLY